MTARMKSLGIDQLSRDERIELVHEICESLENADSDDAMTEEQRKEVEHRLSAHAANPHDAVPWEIVEAEALARIRK